VSRCSGSRNPPFPESGSAGVRWAGCGIKAVRAAGPDEVGRPERLASHAAREMSGVQIEDIDGPLCCVWTKISVKVCTKTIDDSLSRTLIRVLKEVSPAAEKFEVRLLLLRDPGWPEPSSRRGHLAHAVLESGRPRRRLRNTGDLQFPMPCALKRSMREHDRQDRTVVHALRSIVHPIDSEPSRLIPRLYGAPIQNHADVVLQRRVRHIGMISHFEASAARSRRSCSRSGASAIVALTSVSICGLRTSGVGFDDDRGHFVAVFANHYGSVVVVAE